MEEVKKVKLKKDGTLSRQGEGASKENVGRKPSIAKIADKQISQYFAEKWLELHKKYAIPYLESVFEPEQKASHEIKFRVSQEIANRAEGKPKESVDVTSMGKALNPTEEQVKRLSKRHA